MRKKQTAPSVPFVCLQTERIGRISAVQLVVGAPVGDSKRPIVPGAPVHRTASVDAREERLYCGAAVTSGAANSRPTMALAKR